MSVQSIERPQQNVELIFTHLFGAIGGLPASATKEYW